MKNALLDAKDAIWFLGSLLIAGAAAFLTNHFTGKDKITMAQCEERRKACNNLNKVHQDSMNQRLSKIESSVDHINEKLDRLLERKQ